MKYLIIILRVAVAIILLQTLWFKFRAHPDSVYIFSKVGLEPYGRIGIGVVELIAALLILYPKTSWLGAALTVGVIAGAIFMHLTKLGIEVQGDGGTLFYLAVATLIMGLAVLVYHRKAIPIIGAKL